MKPCRDNSLLGSVIDVISEFPLLLIWLYGTQTVILNSLLGSQQLGIISSTWSNIFPMSARYIYRMMARLEFFQPLTAVSASDGFHVAGNTSSGTHASNNSANILGVDFTVKLRTLFDIPSRPRVLFAAYYRADLQQLFSDYPKVTAYLPSLRISGWLIFNKKRAYVF